MRKFNCKLLIVGFTLVEVMITTAILALLLAGVVTILDVGQKTWDTDMGLVDMQQQTRAAMDGMIKEIRQAEISSVNLVSVTEINFEIPSAASPIEYYLNSSQIIREYPMNSGTTKVLANNISSVNFSFVDETIEIQLQAQKTVKGRAITFPVIGNLTETVRLRNN